MSPFAIIIIVPSLSCYCESNPADHQIGITHALGDVILTPESPP